MRIGKHKIIGLLLDRSLSLTEIATKSKLSKPTVLHHLNNLQKQGVVKLDDKIRKYSISIAPEVKEQILSLLIKKKTLEKLAGDLRQLAGKNNPVAQKLVREKDLVDKLNDLLEILYSEGLVIEQKEGTSIGVDGSFTRFIDVWTLTWMGCQELGLCYVCKKPLGSDQYAVANTLNDNWGVTSFFAPIMHTRCFSALEEEYNYNKFGDPIVFNDACDFCGLSLSESRLRSALEFAKKRTGFTIIYNLLRKSEIEALNRWRKPQLEEEFKQYYGFDSPKGMFEGEVLLNDRFIAKLDKEASKKILEKNKNLSKLIEEDGTLEFSWRTEEKPLDFIREPSLSTLDRLFEIIKEGSKEIRSVLDPELRIKDIFTEWGKIQEEVDEKTGKLISELFGDIRSQIYQKLDSITPSYGGDLMIYGVPSEPVSIGYSFIRIEGNKKYHISCYQKLSQSNNVASQDAVEKNRSTKK